MNGNKSYLLGKRATWLLFCKVPQVVFLGWRTARKCRRSHADDGRKCCAVRPLLLAGELRKGRRASWMLTVLCLALCFQPPFRFMLLSTFFLLKPEKLAFHVTSIKSNEVFFAQLNWRYSNKCSNTVLRKTFVKVVFFMKRVFTKGYRKNERWDACYCDLLCIW